ncbi:DUF2062 domain-containing protein [Paenibacillus doosanensis]|uniref:DUF2062 domain-containing protein n=1 Tax=Paenibacillus konkukensis TaxID=2020716 RepID=A0ABY4RUX9_9BACL|nr:MULTISPECIES: DUF2062 domain-containing protein [Paenibacillus]MCS7462763.1 DUF2062 domain-containing protein [Paenibacillus doosanensis]UQZ86028.1 hypothetical protein SK3146_05320 [Paenibacillus konkukensis]
MQQKRTAKSKKPFHVRNIARWFKYKYLLLTRAKGGPSMVAMGFSIGLAIEMFTLPTAGLAFFLIFPFVYLFRGSMAAALIGFVFGKVIYIPMTYFHMKVGGALMPHGARKFLAYHLPDWMDAFIRSNLKLFIGGVIVGIFLGLLVYFPIKWGLELYDSRRKEKRKKRKAQLMVRPESTQ